RWHQRQIKALGRVIHTNRIEGTTIARIVQMVTNVSERPLHNLVDGAIRVKEQLIKDNQIWFQIKGRLCGIEGGNLSVLCSMDYAALYLGNHHPLLAAHLHEKVGICGYL